MSVEHDPALVERVYAAILDPRNRYEGVPLAAIDAVRAWDAGRAEPSVVEVKGDHTVQWCAGERTDVNCIDGLDCACLCHHKWNLTVAGLLRFIEFHKEGYAVVDAAVRARIGWPE